MSAEVVSETTNTDENTNVVNNVEDNKPANSENAGDTKPEGTEKGEEIKGSADELISHWKKFSRLHEANYNALNAEKSTWVKEKESFENKITELTNALNEKSSTLETIQVEALKTKIAHKYDLPETALRFLTGKDEETLEAEAETLTEIAGKNKKPAVIRTQGQQTDSKNAATDPREALKQWQAKALKK